MIILDFHSKTPIYEQIEEQVMLMVRRGVYKPHDRLPSTRSLASELKLNVNTVKRAFPTRARSLYQRKRGGQQPRARAGSFGALGRSALGEGKRAERSGY